jgi:Yip1 domain
VESQSLYNDVPPAAPVEKASVVEDFVDIFYAPSQVYERHREGNFGLALALLCVLGAVIFFATRAVLEPVYDATFEQGMREAMKQNPNLPAGAMETGRKFAMISMMAMAAIGPALMAFFSGLILFMVSRLMDLRPTFTQAMTVTAFAQIPRFTLGTLAMAAQMLLLNPEPVPTAYGIALSPARFLPPDTSMRLVSLAMRFELFTLWATVLIGIGVAVVFRTDKRKGFMTAALVWFVASLLGVAMQR